MPPSPPRPPRTAGASPRRVAGLPRQPHQPLIRDLLAVGRQAFSFEFMPPKTEAIRPVTRTVRSLVDPPAP